LRQAGLRRASRDGKDPFMIAPRILTALLSLLGLSRPWALSRPA